MNYYYLNTVTSNQDIHVMFTRKKISLLCTNQMSKLSIMVTLDFPSATFMGKLKEEKKKSLTV